MVFLTGCMQLPRLGACASKVRLEKLSVILSMAVAVLPGQEMLPARLVVSSLWSAALKLFLQPGHQQHSASNVVCQNSGKRGASAIDSVEVLCHLTCCTQIMTIVRLENEVQCCKSVGFEQCLLSSSHSKL